MHCKPYVLATMLATAIAGCDSPAVSVHPLYTSTDDQNLIKEPRIEGEWMTLLSDLDKAGTKDERWLQTTA